MSTPGALSNYLTTFTEQLSDLLVTNLKLVDVVQIHPGKSSTPEVDELRASDTTRKVYTILISSDTATVVETGESDLNVQAAAFVFIAEPPGAFRDQPGRMTQIQDILAAMVPCVNQNRWGLDCTFPAQNIKTTDLHGLTYAPDQLMGMQGWNPSIQAYAKDLYATGSDQGDPLPSYLSIWVMTWDQRLRIGQNVYDLPDPPAAKDVKDLYIYEALNQWPKPPPAASDYTLLYEKGTGGAS